MITALSILFAPVGAVFVYQFLVAAGAASAEATVAVTMLAAGIGLNALLDKAVKQFQDRIQNTAQAGATLGSP